MLAEALESRLAPSCAVAAKKQEAHESPFVFVGAVLSSHDLLLRQSSLPEMPR